MTPTIPTEDELRAQLTKLLEGVWHSRSVSDVIPEIMQLFAAQQDKLIEELISSLPKKIYSPTEYGMGQNAMLERITALLTERRKKI